MSWFVSSLWSWTRWTPKPSSVSSSQSSLFLSFSFQRACSLCSLLRLSQRLQQEIRGKRLLILEYSLSKRNGTLEPGRDPGTSLKWFLTPWTTKHCWKVSFFSLFLPLSLSYHLSLCSRNTNKSFKTEKDQKGFYVLNMSTKPRTLIKIRWGWGGDSWERKQCPGAAVIRE